MQQLEFDFSGINLLDHYKFHEVIDEGKNDIMSWSDTFSDDGEKLSYDEFIYNTDQCMDFENWIHIDKKNLHTIAYKWFLLFLRSLKKDKNRLEKFKRLLVDLDIKFDEGDWQTIDRNCERIKQEKKATRH